jgi:serine/threonine protein kinase
MKDMWFNIQPHLWTDSTFWMGDPRDPTSKVPYEVDIMRHLTATGQENILRMRGWQVSPENLMYRVSPDLGASLLKKFNTNTSKIYIEYCPNGDGNKLLDHYWALNVTNQIQNGQQQNICIPEPAIWHIFNSLIKAGLTMQGVFMNDNDHVNAEVVHLDLKPDNIFLGNYPPTDPDDDDSSNFAMYPTCKLGDFGMATYRYLAERRSTAYIGRGTGGFFTPEQRHQYHGPKRPHLNAKTNVWGVGITVMALMNLNTAAGNLQFRQAATDETDPMLVPDFTPAAIAGYSAQLRRLVRECVQYRQDDRPSFTALLEYVRQCTVPTPGLRDYALGARFATRNALPAGLTLLNGLSANNYALGTAMPP